MIIKVKVIPNKAKTKISDKKTRSDVDMVVELKAKPEQNRANIELMKFFSEYYMCDISKINIISGIKSTIKTIKIDSNF